jgi:hypothetical protein
VTVEQRERGQAWTSNQNAETLNLNPNGSVKEAKHQHHVITHDDGAATCVSIDDMDLDPRQVPRIPVSFGKFQSCSATKKTSPSGICPCLKCFRPDCVLATTREQARQEMLRQLPPLPSTTGQHLGQEMAATT